MFGAGSSNQGKSPLNNPGKSFRSNGDRGRGYGMKFNFRNSKSMINKRFDYTTQQQMTISSADTQKNNFLSSNKIINKNTVQGSQNPNSKASPLKRTYSTVTLDTSRKLKQA